LWFVLAALKQLRDIRGTIGGVDLGIELAALCEDGAGRHVRRQLAQLHDG
jgi:hypothetical protein